MARKIYIIECLSLNFTAKVTHLLTSFLADDQFYLDCSEVIKKKVSVKNFSDKNLAFFVYFNGDKNIVASATICIRLNLRTTED